MIFVTGGTGLLGNCILRELAARGVPARALCRPATDHAPLADLDLEIVQGDLSDPDLLSRAIRGCRAVIHSAAFIHLGWSRLDQSRAVNVAGTRHVVQACAEQGARLIHISTVDTLPAARCLNQPIDERGQGGLDNPPCNYVISKREAEQVVRQAMSQHRLDAVIIHPGFMLGPYDWKPSSGRMLWHVARAPLAFAPRGGCSVCDARDVASGVVNAVSQGVSGQAYILAGENISYRQLWSRMRQVAGRSPRVFCPHRVLSLVGHLSDAVYRILPLREGDLNGAVIAMGQLNHYYRSDLAVQQLEYRPRPLDQTLADAWQWLQQQRVSQAG